MKKNKIQAAIKWYGKAAQRKKLFVNRRLQKRYRLAYHDCDKYGNVRIATILNILQDITQNHTCRLGYGKEYFIQKKGWMVVRYSIKIDKYPKVEDKITVLTWISETTKISLTREFEIKNSYGKTLIKVTSKWVLVDLNTKRFLEVPKFSIKRKTVLKHFEQPKLQRKDVIRQFTVLFDNIDFNGHVNNSVYPVWASETIPAPFRTNNIPERLSISFQKECLFGEDVTVATQLDGQTTISEINSLQGSRLASVAIYWKEITALA